MTEQATQRSSVSSGNPLTNHVLYWRVSALALAAVALLGLVVNAIGGSPAWVPDSEVARDFLAFDWSHNILHVGLAGIAGVFGFTALRHKPIARTMAATVGVVYLGLGVLGFVPAVTEFLDEFLALHLEVGENLIHLALGAWGAYAGFTS